MSFPQMMFFAIAAIGWTATLQAQTYVVRSGDTLQKIAAEFYGSEHFDKVIVKINKLSSTKEAVDGKSIQVPDLKELLFKEGLNRNAQTEIDLLLKARYTYMTHRNDLLKAVNPGNSKGKINVPVIIRNDLLEAAKEIETAAAGLAKKGNFFENPIRMRRELLAISANIKKMARGKYKKDYDESVHKKLALTFFHGIAWARDEEGNRHKLAH